MSDAPLLQAELTDGGLWRVWCKYCERYHHHGPQPGHRLAHCAPATPYTVTGYTLVNPNRITDSRESGEETK